MRNAVLALCQVLLLLLLGCGWGVSAKSAAVAALTGAGAPDLDKLKLVHTNMLQTDQPWKSACVGIGNTVVHDDRLGKWVMLYAGSNTDCTVYNSGWGHEQIGAATSVDGVTWTDVPNNPVLPVSAVPGDPDYGAKAFPQAVLYGGTWYVFAICTATPGYESGQNNICLDTTPASQPLTTPTWTHHGIVIAAASVPWAGRTLCAVGSSICSQVYRPNVVQSGGRWYMFFNGGPTAGPEDVGYAVAGAPGGPWTVHATRVLCQLTQAVPATECTGENTFPLHAGIADPEVIRYGDYFVMTGWTYAESSDPYRGGAELWQAYTTAADFPEGWHTIGIWAAPHATRQTMVTIDQNLFFYAMTDLNTFDVYSF